MQNVCIFHCHIEYTVCLLVLPDFCFLNSQYDNRKMNTSKVCLAVTLIILNSLLWSSSRLSFEIVSDWKLSLKRLLLVISFAHWTTKTSIFTCPIAIFTCPRQSNLGFISCPALGFHFCRVHMKS